MTEDAWLAKHPYLQSIAEFEALVENALAKIPNATARVPNFDDYTSEFVNGVPLLRSANTTIDLPPAEKLLTSLVESMATKLLPVKQAQECQALVTELHQRPDTSRHAVDWLLNPDGHSFTPAHSGLVRYLGWKALAKHLSPVVDAFARWRDEERWLRSYCPTCGSLPAMAQLAGSEPGRLRLLWCGCCRTRWRFRRTGCPFCEKQDDHRLTVLAVEGEGGLRIDYCEVCGGYLKTYDGEGNEEILLADWTSLHLDIIASDRGLKRLAGSLYQL